MLGKKIGSDVVRNKKTYLLIKALEYANPSQKETLLYWQNQKEFDEHQKIHSIKTIFDEIGMGEIYKKRIDTYFLNIENILLEINISEDKKDWLRDFSKSMIYRTY